MTKGPAIKADRPPIGSHLPVAWGWDTIYEAYDLFPSGRTLSFLEAWKEIAAADGEYLLVQVAGHDFYMLPTGKLRWPWVLEDADGEFVIKLRGPEAPEYGVMVEYRSPLLWSLDDPFDWSEAQARIYDLLRQFCVPKGGEEGPALVSRADYAFDFYAPEWTRQSAPEQWDNWCCHQEVKRNAKTGDIWGRRQVETWTLGSRKSLQVQLYNKALEITEASGKTWMHDIYKATSDHHRIALYTGDKPVDVWRLEFRMFKDWLKRRHFGPEKEKARRRETFVANAKNIVHEAMSKIILKVPDGPGRNKQLTRRPAHWFWGAAADAVGGAVERPYVANLASMRRDALADIGRKSVAGYIRSLSVLDNADCDDMTYDEIMQEMRAAIFADPRHEKKMDLARRRYAMIDRPR